MVRLPFERSFYRPARNPVGRAAKALWAGLSGGQADRRETARQRVVDRNGRGGNGRQRVLNVSRTGLAIEVPAKCRFATGERHRFRLKVASGEVEVEGRVCWTESSWTEREGAEVQVYRQRVGFDLAESIDHQTGQIWDILRAMVTDFPIGMEVADSRPVKRLV